ncbi:MAG: WbqC family protein [Eubacteriales bacterium]|nr:WbqC family protein [Eubacteriales bacterium]
MKLGIMQPYFFPYLGYWQLMNAVDTYVVCDDVTYIKGGWINRNQIKINGAPSMICVPVKDVSQNRMICKHELAIDEKQKQKLCQSVDLAYRHAPYHADVMQLFCRVMDAASGNLVQFLLRSIRDTAEYLGIQTQLLLSSEMEKDTSKKKQEKILDICSRLNATEYYNAIGGKALYDAPTFREHGIDLHFLKMDEDIRYPQGKGDFLPYLSILDVMMYNSKEEFHALLSRYTLE